MLRKPWERHQQVQVSIVPTQYEDRSGIRPGVAPGVPFLSLTERGEGSAPYFIVGTLNKAMLGCDHQAKAVRNLPAEAPSSDWNTLLDAARKNWSAWLATAPTVNAKGALRFGPAPDQLLNLDMPALIKHFVP